MEKNQEVVQKEFKTFMRREDKFPTGGVKSIYNIVALHLSKSNYELDDFMNKRQIQDLFINRIKYLMTTTTREMCGFIYEGFEDETKSDKSEGQYILFNRLLYSTQTMIDIAPHMYANIYCNDTYKLFDFDLFDKEYFEKQHHITDETGCMIKDAKTICDNIFLEGMNKAEILFNIFMQGEVNKEIDSDKMIKKVSTIADIYTYTLARLLVEYICIYLPKINSDLSISSDDFYYIMKFYNQKTSMIDQYYNKL